MGKPRTLWIISAFFYLGFVANIIPLILATFFPQLAFGVGYNFPGGYFLIDDIIYLIFAFAYFIVGWSVWALKSWGRIYGIVVAVAGIVFDAYRIFTDAPLEIYVPSLIILAFIAAYLYSKKDIFSASSKF